MLYRGTRDRSICVEVVAQMIGKLLLFICIGIDLDLLKI
jgi:hypothetical protein